MRNNSNKQFHPSAAARLAGSGFPSVVLEIGANDGEDTERFCRSFRDYEARIFCFECDPRAIGKWRERIKDARASLEPIALADQCGPRTFHPSGGIPEGHSESWNKSGSLLPFDQHGKYATWMEFPEPIDVTCTTLDCWAEDNLPEATCPVIDFAWVDVQGAEAMVLKGGQKTIRRVMWFYAECDPRPLYKGMAKLPDLEKLLPGFQLHSEWADSNFLWRNTDRALRQKRRRVDD